MVKGVDNKGVVEFVLEYICCRFGVFLELLSDSGPGFRGEVITQLCDSET